jgi:hypothetical protein
LWVSQFPASRIPQCKSKGFDGRIFGFGFLDVGGYGKGGLLKGKGLLKGESEWLKENC